MGSWYPPKGVRMLLEARSTNTHCQVSEFLGISACGLRAIELTMPLVRAGNVTTAHVDEMDLAALGCGLALLRG
jgi:hypothetical protein